jgi:hypothetical protein
MGPPSYNQDKYQTPTYFGTGIPSSGSLVEQGIQPFQCQKMYEFDIYHELYCLICNLVYFIE